MQDLTMSSEEEEYDGTSDEEEFESDEGEGHVSQIRFLSDKRLKATNLMSLFDCKVGNRDNEVIVSMVECWWATTHTFHLPYGELGITPRDFTVHTGISIRIGEPMVLDESYMEEGNALTISPNIESKDFEKGCISFAHLWTYLDHTRVNIKDPTNANTIFRSFMLLHFRGVLFGNSKSWARLELLGPIILLEKKGPTINFGSAISGHLYYCLDEASKQEAVLDIFIDSLSEEEEEEDIDESSTDYSDDNVIDTIKIKILSNQAKIDELEEAKSSGTRVGLVVGHKTINRSRVFYHKQLMHDYFCDKNVYRSKHFLHRFPMSR
ncbi:hypothetical protein GIB67_036951 [Kingdonia uniflora]|uniref:Aminotransferase-like plant mobile domain-containing protein n=1 Tax=Kingdonia uniflora TaxID=39325 RepID=A0A7J7NW10_9MAGN|nr:hypothetical protein GIB67_036951 [Kingdonia uniflora]